MTATVQQIAPSFTKVTTPDQDLADYFKKCSNRQLEDESCLARSTIRILESQLGKAKDAMEVIMLYQDIQYAQDRQFAIISEFKRREIP